MPQANSSYEKIVNRANKFSWYTLPEYDVNFNYDNLFKLVKYSKHKIELGKTHSPVKWDDYFELIKKYDSIGRGVTLNKLIFVYGDIIGRTKFNEYRKKQAYSNSFKYKNEKYGLTEDEFINYNKSRAVTLVNLVKKHGEQKGKTKYEEYCNRQAFTNTKEHLGEERYEKVCRAKSHSLSVYVEKYGDEIGKKKFKEYFEKVSSIRTYSKISQDMFKEVELLLNEKEKNYSFYATKNKEYALLYENRCFLYDFICTELKMCIEYHGDHYHGNPSLYRPDDFLRARGCTKIRVKDKWKQDDIKINWLKTQRGYDTIVVWDSDWRKNSNSVLESIEKWINNRRLTLKENLNEFSV